MEIEPSIQVHKVEGAVCSVGMGDGSFCNGVFIVHEDAIGGKEYFVAMERTGFTHSYELV